MAGQLQKPASLPGLPTELRLQILEYLIPTPTRPDFETFQCAKAYTDADRLEYCIAPPKGHNCNDYVPPCHTNILRVNRQLYADGISVLYRRTCSMYLGEKVITMFGKNWIRTFHRKVAEDFGLLWRLSHVTKLRIQIAYLNTHVAKYLVSVLREIDTVKDVTLVVRRGSTSHLTQHGDGFDVGRLKIFHTLRNLRKFAIEKDDGGGYSMSLSQSL